MNVLGMAGVILAGGKSQRMGRDKSLLIFPGGKTTFLGHLHLTLSHFFDRVIVISNRNDGLHAGFQVYRDSEEGLGPVGGILTGFQHTDHQSLFICACDMPKISREAIGYFLERADSEKISVALVNRRIEPLFSSIPRKFQSDLLDYVRSGGR
ncbi:MAG: molybdenum cofactor guanylyltransferase, partial [Leptospirales bacterium]